MLIYLEAVEIEGEERAGTAEAVAEEEPDIAKGGGGGCHVCPDGDVTGWAQLRLGTLSLSILSNNLYIDLKPVFLTSKQEILILWGSISGGGTE